MRSIRRPGRRRPQEAAALPHDFAGEEPHGPEKPVHASSPRGISTTSTSNPRIPKSELIKYREGLLVGSACEAGELFRAVVKGESLDEPVRNRQLLRLPGNPAPGQQHVHGAQRHDTDEEGLREYNRTIVRTGRKAEQACGGHLRRPLYGPQGRGSSAGSSWRGQGFDDADQQAPLYLRTTDGDAEGILPTWGRRRPMRWW